MTDTSQELPLRLVFETIPKLRKQKDWVGGFGKWLFMQTSVLYLCLGGWVQKMTIYTDFSIVFTYMSGWVRKSSKVCWHNMWMVSLRLVLCQELIYWLTSYPKTISVTSKVRIDFTNVGNLKLRLIFLKNKLSSEGF